MNPKRILLGGLVGGLVMFVIDGFANAVVLGPAWGEAYAALSELVNQQVRRLEPAETPQRREEGSERDVGALTT